MYWIIKINGNYHFIKYGVTSQTKNQILSYLKQKYEEAYEAPDGAESHLDVDIDIQAGSATLNQTKKDARLQAEADAQAAEDQERSDELAARQAIKDRIANYKTQSENLQSSIDAMTNLADAKTVLTQLNNGLINLIEDIGKIAQRSI